MIKQLEYDNNVKPFKFNFDHIKIPVISDQTHEDISKAFRSTKVKPTDRNMFEKYYFGLLKNIFGKRDIVDNKRFSNSKNVHGYKYFVDGIILKHYLELYHYTNSRYKDIESSILNLVGIENFKPFEQNLFT